MIALDTSALIWAVQSESSGGVERDRMAAVQQMAKNLVVLPAPALAEYLVGIPPDARNAAVGLLQKFATVIPFDYRASIICADLFKVPHGTRHRQGFKVDAMILATAIAHGATHFLHRDAGFGSLAKNQRINLVRVDSILVQGGLPFDAPGGTIPAPGSSGE